MTHHWAMVEEVNPPPILTPCNQNCRGRWNQIRKSLLQRECCDFSQGGFWGVHNAWREYISVRSIIYQRNEYKYSTSFAVKITLSESQRSAMSSARSLLSVCRWVAFNSWKMQTRSMPTKNGKVHIGNSNLHCGLCRTAYVKPTQIAKPKVSITICCACAYEYHIINTTQQSIWCTWATPFKIGCRRHTSYS